MDNILTCSTSLHSLDPNLFRLWLEGNSEQEAFANVLRSSTSLPLQYKFNDRITSNEEINDDYLLRSEINDSYKLFNLLQHNFNYPYLLPLQNLIQFDKVNYYSLLEKYYNLDNNFYIEIFNRKLIGKLKKELEEISTILNIKIKSILRQYNNFRRIYSSLYEEPTGANQFFFLKTSSSINNDYRERQMLTAASSSAAASSVNPSPPTTSVVNSSAIGTSSVSIAPISSVNYSSSNTLHGDSMAYTKENLPHVSLSTTTTASSVAPSTSSTATSSASASSSSSSFFLNRSSYCLFISSQYKISISLARKYVSLSYLLYEKFNLSYNNKLRKKKLTQVDSWECVSASLLVFLVMNSNQFNKLYREEEKFINEKREREREILNNDIIISSPSSSPSVTITSATTSPSSLNFFQRNMEDCWNFVWKLFYLNVKDCECDKTLLNNLRSLRSILYGESLDFRINKLKSLLGSTIIKKIDGNNSSFVHSSSSSNSSSTNTSSSSSISSSTLKIKNIFKNLLLIASNLSQNREFRDLFDDLLIKVGDILFESNLTNNEKSIFLEACVYCLEDHNGNSEHSMAKFGSFKMDWFRFICFVNCCLSQLLPFPE